MERSRSRVYCWIHHLRCARDAVRVSLSTGPRGHGSQRQRQVVSRPHTPNKSIRARERRKPPVNSSIVVLRAVTLDRTTMFPESVGLPVQIRWLPAEDQVHVALTGAEEGSCIISALQDHLAASVRWLLRGYMVYSIILQVETDLVILVATSTGHSRCLEQQRVPRRGCQRA